jgi:outer membrane receptor protein involved in Fe transport
MPMIYIYMLRKKNWLSIEENLEYGICASSLALVTSSGKFGSLLGLGAGLLFVSLATPTWANAPQDPRSPTSGKSPTRSVDLSGMSLEALSHMHISISSFPRKKDDLQKTPAAVFVISKEDIARSAATSIPELLRMVPGVQVVQINASSWAVSARGFNSQYSSKLLVLIDGRTIYPEINSGAQWIRSIFHLGI